MRTPGLLSRQNLRNPLLLGGLGLLAQGPSLTPQNPFGNAMQGFMAGLQLNRQQARDARERERWEAEQERYAQAQERRETRGQAFSDLLHSLPPEVAAQLGGADALGRLGPEIGMDVVAPHLRPEKPGAPNLKQVWDPESQTATWTTAEEAIGRPAVPRAPMVSIHDAPKPPPGYAFSDPSNPMAGVMPIPGGPADPTAAASKAATVEQAKNEAMIGFLEQEVETARQEYDTAKAAFEKSLDPTGPEARELSRAQERLRRAEAGRANWRGEPSGDVARSVVPEPGVGRTLLEQGRDLVEGLFSGEEATAAPDEKRRRDLYRKYGLE